jgi:pimeloyl-ACP methyl ester carboxylesterase
MAAPATFSPYKFETAKGRVVDAELGEMRVPANRTKPNSPTIAIRFIRFKSTSSHPGSPIVYLAGGPGNSGITAAMGTRFDMFMALREFGDVIAYDQRGTGQSEPDANCTETFAADPSRPLDRATYGAAVAAAMQRCADRLRKSGVDIDGLNTRESAADLNDLRLALGAKKLTLWGISYGAHLGAAALRNHPGAIERVILAGIEGPDDTYKLPSDTQTLMEDVARLAHQDGKSHDLLGSIARLLRELEARPKSVAVTHLENGTTTTFVFGKLDLQRALTNLLFGPDSFAGMPDFVARLEGGDWMSLALAMATERFDTAPSMLSTAMDCASGISEGRRARIAEEAKWALLGDSVNLPFPEICAGVRVPDLGDAFRAPVVSDVPALLISGTLDGRTRPRQAEEFRRMLPNATTLVIDGAGHSDPLYLSSPKIFESMKQFLRGEPVTERYITLPKMTFQPLRKVAAVRDEVLSRYVGTYRLDTTMQLRVVKAGSVLYLVPTGNSPVALRPISEQEFFTDAIAFDIAFVVEDGKSTALLLRPAGGAELRAPREPREAFTER